MSKRSSAVAPGENVLPPPPPDVTLDSDGVDLTAIRWMLRLSPLERLEAAQDLLDGAKALKPGDEA